MYILLKEIRDYNDEFDTESFVVMPIEEYEKYKKATDDYLEDKINNREEPIWLGFGSNEEHIVESVEDYWNCINIREISDDEFYTLRKLFGFETDETIRFGTNSWFFPLEEY